MHSTSGDGPAHPEYCDRDCCAQRGSDLNHRSRTARIIPEQRGCTDARSVDITVQRLDEYDEATGVQIEYPDEIVLRYDDGTVRYWGVEDLRAVYGAALAMADARAADRERVNVDNVPAAAP